MIWSVAGVVGLILLASSFAYELGVRVGRKREQLDIEEFHRSIEQRRRVERTR